MADGSSIPIHTVGEGDQEDEQLRGLTSLSPHDRNEEHWSRIHEENGSLYHISLDTSVRKPDAWTCSVFGDEGSHADDIAAT